MPRNAAPQTQKNAPKEAPGSECPPPPSLLLLPSSPLSFFFFLPGCISGVPGLTNLPPPPPPPPAAAQLPVRGNKCHFHLFHYLFGAPGAPPPSATTFYEPSSALRLSHATVPAPRTRCRCSPPSSRAPMPASRAATRTFRFRRRACGSRCRWRAATPSRCCACMASAQPLRRTTGYLRRPWPRTRAATCARSCPRSPRVSPRLR
jgi:hypothetical protein